MNAKRILIVNPFGIGDILFSTPLVASLRKIFPDSYIGYICNIRTKDILYTNPDIDEVFIFDRGEYRALWKQSKMSAIKKFLRFWGAIKKKKINALFDLSLGKEFAFICWLIGIKERRGFNYKGRGRFLTDKILFTGFTDKPVAEYYLDLIASTSQAHKTVLHPTDKDKAYIENFLEKNGINKSDILVSIAPGGGISFGEKNKTRRRWGAEKFAALGDKIIEQFNAKIILIWGNGEYDLVKKIQGLMKQKALIAPETSIREMAAICKRSRLVVCSEGGPLHIAVSQGIKTISIFGPVDEKVYGPYPDSVNNVVITSKIHCRPCYQSFKLPECDNRKCIEDISVDEVLKAVRA